MIKQFKIGEFGKTLIKFASSQLLTNALRIISGFLVVMLLDPAEYGKYTGVGVYLGYILIGHFGVINGLGRELPYEIGKGNKVYAEQLASSVFSLTLLLSLTFFLIFICVGIFKIIHNDPSNGILFITYSLLAGFHLFNKQLLPVLYRTNRDFKSLSRQNIIIGIINFVTIIFVFYLGFVGLIIRGLVISIAEFYLLFVNSPSKLKLTYYISDLKKLLKTGFPNFIVGQINPGWITITNNIIIAFGGAFNYGLYSLCSIVQSAVGIIPAAFSQIIYPKMAISFGEGKNVRNIIRSNVKPLIFQFLFLLLVSILGYILLPIFVKLLLPKYSNGIKAAQIMFFVPVVQSFGALNNIFNVTKKQLYYIISFFCGAVVGGITSLCLIKHFGFKLEYFSIGILFGTFIQQFLSFISLYILFFRTRI